MSFFKEFKDDLSQAVSELIPDSELFAEEIDGQNIDGVEDDKSDILDFEKSVDDTNLFDDIINDKLNTIKAEKAKEKVTKNVVKTEEQFSLFVDEEKPVETKPETIKKPEPVISPISSESKSNSNDEVTVITKGATVKGNFNTDGSLEVRGSILGDIECSGKLSIYGKVTGNSKASEMFINTVKLEGSLDCEGSIKVGVNSVIIGNITATSVNIAGAIKGDMDVNGPVIIDSTAIILGNIQARSIQINNGAIIEGFCSLSYADTDIKSIFE